MRRCVQCGAQDRQIGDSEHWVVPELRWLPKGETQVSPRAGRAGWGPKMVQGRPAMERMMCRACLDANELRDRVWGGMRKAAREAERAPDDRYWLTLCEAEG